MSASEKLKALEGSLTDYDAFVRALPQIVALTEAAERVDGQFLGGPPPTVEERGFALQKLRVALDALDEALQ